MLSYSLGHSSFIHCSFIHLSIIWGHMGCPHDSAIMNKAAVVIGEQASTTSCIQFLMVLYPRGEINGSHDKSVLTF